MDSVTIVTQERAEVGKKGAKAVRKEGLVPAVVYGGDKVYHFSASQKDFKPLVYTGDFKLANIEMDGKSLKCIVKEMQFHPVTDNLVHIDFLELVPNKSFKVELPVKFKGSAPGVRTGGSLNQKVRRVKVKTTPEKLVSELFVDISALELGSSVRVRDIEVGDGIELMTAEAIPVASVEIPRALRSAASEEEDAAAAAEGEDAATAEAEA